VPLKTYDESIDVLRKSLDTAKVDGGEKSEGFRRLHQFVKAMDTRLRTEVDFRALVAHEKRISPSLDGRSVPDDRARNKRRAAATRMNPQMNLFP